MAEFALGLTKTAVEGTLSRVKLAIEEEAKLKARVQQDLVFIRGEFQMMQSFLKVASAERVNNEVVKTWVRQLRDLAFDVEDCVEFVVHLDESSALTWLWRVVPSCMAPPRHLDEAAAEIKMLKARLEDVSCRNTRYNLIIETGSKPVPLVELPATDGVISTFHILCEVWEAAGKRRGMGDLQKLITSEGSDLQVISVWGSPGAHLGMMSIIRKAYDDSEICQEFKHRAWVNLKLSFDLDDFLKSLLAQFYPVSHQAKLGMDFRKRMKLAVATEDDLMKAELIQQLSEQRYLLVLENVSTMVEWDAIRMYLPESKNGSRIIVSTQHLGISLACTGEPYQVSELRRFSDCQYLCAFFKKGSNLRSDMGELMWQLRRRGVISVWGTGDGKRNEIIKVYNGIRDKSKEFNGVEYEQHSGVSIPDPFDLKIFSQDLLEDFYSEEQTKEIEAVYMMEEAELIQCCCKFLREHDCLVVLDDVRSTHDWDVIKATFLSEPIDGSIVVITNEESVATHCVDHEYRAVKYNDLVADVVLRSSLKGFQDYSGTVGNSCRFSSRKEEAREWIENFQWVERKEKYELIEREEIPGLPSLWSVWGIAGVGKSTLVRDMYYREVLGGPKLYGLHGRLPGRFSMFSWVDVPHPFSLTDFFQRLFLDFYSDDLQAKESAAVGIMEGQDPIQGCCKFLSEHECFVVIDGLRSTHDWDLIKAVFLSEPAKGRTIVITSEASVARHCVQHEYLALNIKVLEADTSLELFSKIASGGKELISDEMELLEDTVARCGGIAKVIAAVGQYLGSSTILLKFLNDNFMRNLETGPRFHSLSGLFSWMHSYFDACSDALKPCIFYLSVFRPNNNIRRRRLLRRWIAEGYSRDTYGTPAEKNGEMFFSKLVDLSIIQQPQNKALCQVNAFFYGYIISRPMEDNLVFELDGSCIVDSQRTGQHLTIRSTWHRDINVFESIDFSRLRSLTMFGKWESFLISNKMKRLRVLDLENTSGVTNDDLKQIIGKLLTSLKFLSLRGCKEITRLPNSLGGLRQLQTLDVKNTSIVTLPPAIIKLQMLQYIRAGTTEPRDEGDAVVALLEDRTSTPPEDSGGVVTSLPAEASPPEYTDGAVALIQDRTSTPPEDSDGVVTILPAQVSPPEYNGDGMATSLPKSPPPENGDDISSSLPGAAPLAENGDTVTSLSAASEQDQTSAHPDKDVDIFTMIEESSEDQMSMPSDEVDGMLTIPPEAEEGRASRLSWSRPRGYVSNWLSKFSRNPLVGTRDGIVVPAGIGKLTALHTLGVVNVNAAGGKAILKEFKNLTQLRKLKVSGINGQNWQHFCSAISGHGHLESLSVRINKDKEGLFCCLDDTSQLPSKTLKCLKLYGHVHNLPDWIKHLDNLERLDVEMTILVPENISAFSSTLLDRDILHRLCLKPIQECKLHLSLLEDEDNIDTLRKFSNFKVLEIDCTTRLHVTFGHWISTCVRSLIIRCSSGSSIRFSGLKHLPNLREVWLKGSYDDALKQHLLQKISKHLFRPVLKLEKPCSS